MEVVIPRRPFVDGPPDTVRRQDGRLYPVIEVVDLPTDAWKLVVSDEPYPEHVTTNSCNPPLTAFEGTWSLD